MEEKKGWCRIAVHDRLIHHKYAEAAQYTLVWQEMSPALAEGAH